ncbi:MAG: ornithine carbamoyltransferase, partial [Rhodocyclaceae bacterium]|nr:ornithine carbamoyltransferase [Rhodocyclaceae bacterium]
MKHFLKFSDFSKDEFDHIIERTTILKKRFKQYIPYQPLTDRMLAMVFE